VGIGGGTVLFATMLVLAVAFDFVYCEGASIGTGFGGVDARITAIASAAFKLLFYDLPFAVLVFVAWAVGESDARERWGERLASADALLGGDAFNATVGRSTLVGLLAGPAVAAAALLLPGIAVRLGAAHASLGEWSSVALLSRGGPLVVVLQAATCAV